jgi:putative transposase
MIQIMKRLKALRVRIYPTADQAVAFARIAGSCRFVYNLGLEQRSSFWRQHKRTTGRAISWVSQKRELTALKAAAPFLKEAPSHCLQEALADLDRAYGNFFAGLSGYPQPRRKFENDSFTFPDPKQIRVDRGQGLLILPKFGKTAKDPGPIRAVLHRPLHGRLRRVTISREGAHWYASILMSKRLRRADEPAPGNEIVADDVVGIDRGVAVPTAVSTGALLGVQIENEARLRKQRRLAKALSRTQRGSKRRMRALARLQVHKARMVRRRRDMIHKITSHVAKNHRVVVIETLRVRAMTASAKGTIEEPGRNVAAKSGLNRAILDKGWGEMRRQLKYKLSWAGGRLIEVDPRNTSRTCGCCTHVDAASRIDRDRFVCRSCGHKEHADINAARVIRQRGLRDLGLEEQLRPERSWQPEEPSAQALAMRREEKKDGISHHGSHKAAGV